MAEQLAVRFELKPSASHLLVGGVGSGKTTQLLVAREKLEAVGDVCAVYVDVSLRRDPSSLDGADLVEIACLAFIDRLQSSEERAGFEAAMDETNYKVYVGSQDPWLPSVIERYRAHLESICAALRRQQYSHFILLVDSLDRLSDLKRFADIAEEGVAALRSLGIGVILVGPLTSLYGLQRVIHDRFDRVWHIPAMDVDNDAEGRDFLCRVLRARDTGKLLFDRAVHSLVGMSGGVLRDLVALTQAAGEEAYVDGADNVEPRHVEIAADVFGRKQMVAIDSEQLEVLQRVRTKGTFVQTSEKDLALLATRRVLEYTDGRPRFAVHPTIAPLLAQLAGAA